MAFRNYFSLSILGVLVVWGPIDYSRPAWLIIRLGYVIIIPLAVWFLLGWIWNRRQLKERVTFALERLLSLTICIVLFAFAILEATSQSHVSNSKWIRTRDGMEAVGEDVLLQGPDWGNVIVMVAIATILLWFGVIKNRY